MTQVVDPIDGGVLYTYLLCDGIANATEMDNAIHTNASFHVPPVADLNRCGRPSVCCGL